MQRVAGEVELQHVPHARIVAHVVEPGGLHPALSLRSGVGAEVSEQVAARHDVAAIPRVAVGIGQQRAAPGDDGLLRVHPAEHRADHRIGSSSLGGRGSRGAF